MIARRPTNDIQSDTICHSGVCPGEKGVGLCVSQRGYSFYYYFLFAYARVPGTPLHAGRRE